MRYIKLTKNKEAIVDNDDYEWLSKYNWCAKEHKNEGRFYAVRGEGPRKTMKIIRMHRVILNAPKGSEVDHINGNTLDNRKSNLRIVSRNENAKNMKKHKDGLAKYKGVSKLSNGKTNPWRARIWTDNKELSLGAYKTQEEAALVYDLAAILYFGAYAHTNFKRL